MKEREYETIADQTLTAEIVTEENEEEKLNGELEFAETMNGVTKKTPVYYAIVNAIYSQLLSNTLRLKEFLDDEINKRKEADSTLKGDFKTALAEFGNSIIEEITIPKSSWKNNSGGGYYAEVSTSKAMADRYPLVTPSKGSTAAIKDADVSHEVECEDGVLRFFSDNIPSGDISATVVFLYPKEALSDSNSTGGGESSGSGYMLPVATDSRLGGVKIGSGIDVTNDGTISVDGEITKADMTTDEEREEMLKEVFG